MRNCSIALVAIFVVLFGLSLHGAPPPAFQKSSPDQQRSSIDNEVYIDANNILMFVTNHGSFARDINGVFGYGAGAFYPYFGPDFITLGTLTNNTLYAAGLWFGGMVNGELRTAIVEYDSEFGPGPMAGGTYQSDNASFRVYKLHSDSLESNPNDDFTNWPVDQGAPVDEFGRPVMLGDQMLWSVFNDADPSRHTNNASSTSPLGIEIQQTVWAMDSEGTDTSYILRSADVTHVGPSRGSVEIVGVIDPGQFTSDEYMLVFDEVSPGTTVWHLFNNTTGVPIILAEADQGGVMQHEVDGFLFSVTSSAPESLDWSIPNGVRRFTWANADYGFEAFSGSLGNESPYSIFNLGVSGEPIDVLLKLATTDLSGNFSPADPNGSYAYRFGRGFISSPARPEFAPFMINTIDGGYRYQDFTKNMPISAWDVSVEPARRLALAFLENNTVNGLLDGKYFPGSHDNYNNVASDGPREWLFILNDDYTESPKPEYNTELIDDANIPIIYWMTANRRGDVAFETGDEFKIEFRDMVPNSEADTFYFSAPGIITTITGGQRTMINMKYKLYNKGANNIENCYISMWVDPDLGFAGDDVVGCDSINNIFYCYNSDNDDEGQFGSSPPAVGFKLINGPLVPAAGKTGIFDGLPMGGFENLPMTAFAMYKNGTDPNIPQEIYNYMQGLNANGSSYTYNEVPVKFMFSGDPAAIPPEGDLDSDPSDRRMLASFGPFNFASGDSQFVRLRLAVGHGSSNLNSIDKLKETLNQPEPDPSCCRDRRGNANADTDDRINIADVTYLVDYLFGTPLGAEPVCRDEGNANADFGDKVNIADITYLMDYLFGIPLGPPPPACP